MLYCFRRLEISFETHILELYKPQQTIWLTHKVSMASHSRVQYLRLRNLRSNDNISVDHDVPDIDNAAEGRGQKPYSIRRRLGVKKVILLLSLILNVISAWRLLFSRTLRDQILTYCEPLIPAQCFQRPLTATIAPVAPALTAVENERVVFSSAFGIERSPFQGEPSEENNRLWAGLYDCR